MVTVVELPENDPLFITIEMVGEVFAEDAFVSIESAYEKARQKLSGFSISEEDFDANFDKAAGLVVRCEC